MNKQNVALGLAVVAVIIASVALYVRVTQSLGSVGSRFPNGLCVGSSCSVTQNDLTVGNSGTAQANQVTKTCSIISNASIGATSTGYGYCTGLTGITSADNIAANFASSTVLMTDQWAIVGAFASTTAGAVDFRLLNLTGQARAFSAASTIGSSTAIHASH